MPQISAPLTINDGQATPVAKTFAPVRIAPELSIFSEKSSGVSAGFTNLIVKSSPSSGTRPTDRVDVDLDLPVLSTVNGVSTVAYTLRFKSYFVIPKVATVAERANLVAYAANALANATIKAPVKDLDPLY